MWNLIFHLWAGPPTDITLACPPPAEGQSGNPTGFYDTATVSAAFNHVAIASVAIVLALVLVCYLLTQSTTGAGFVKRWWGSLAGAAVFCAVAAFGILSFAPTTARAGSCETNPAPFPIALPPGLITDRALAGLAWGALAFLLMSVLSTLVLGRIASKRNGFFHNRGVPVPRFTP